MYGWLKRCFCSSLGQVYAPEAVACLAAAAHNLAGFLCVLLLQQLGAGVARRRKLLLAS